MLTCTNCGNENRNSAMYCDQCGQVLQEDKGITNTGQVQMENQNQKEEKVFAVLGWIFNVMALAFFPILFGPLGIIMGYFHKKYHTKHANIIIVAAVICMVTGMVFGAATAPAI